MTLAGEDRSEYTDAEKGCTGMNGSAEIPARPVFTPAGEKVRFSARFTNFSGDRPVRLGAGFVPASAPPRPSVL